MSADFSIGYHAPPRSARTGVADYAWRLFEELQRNGRVIPDAANATLHVYHLGNNPLHNDVYTRALATPGVVILHDAVLHHFLLGRLSADEYLAEWVHNYGEWRRDLGRELWEQRASSPVDPRYFRYPMLRRAMERARLVVVHNPGAAAMAKAHGAERVITLPHFYEPLPAPDPAALTEFRRGIGVAEDTTLFGIFGYLRETKRVLPSIRAFLRLHKVRPRTALLLAGECVSAELARLLRTEASHPAIRRADHLPARQFHLAIAAIDCCLNLRYPAAGETSGIAVRMMGSGKPVILTENLENSLYPAGSCLPVTSGIAEQAELFDYMGLVTDFPSIAREIGAEAARHIRAEHSLSLVASKLWEALTWEALHAESSAMRS